MPAPGPDLGRTSGSGSGRPGRPISPAYGIAVRSLWSVEEGGGALLRPGVERVEVRPLRRGGVDVVEHLLDVPEVEEVSPVGPLGPMRHPGGGPAQVVG